MHSFFRLWLLPTALRTSPHALCSPPLMPDMVSQLWEKCDHKASFVFSYQSVTNRICFLVCSQFLLFHSRKRRSDWPCVASRDGPSVKREIGGRKAKASPSVTYREDKRWMVRFKEQLRDDGRSFPTGQCLLQSRKSQLCGNESGNKDLQCKGTVSRERDFLRFYSWASLFFIGDILHL